MPGNNTFLKFVPYKQYTTGLLSSINVLIGCENTETLLNSTLNVSLESSLKQIEVCGCVHWNRKPGDTKQSFVWLITSILFGEDKGRKIELFRG